MKKLIACLATALVSATALAATKPFNLSITPDVAVYDRSDTIQGLTLSIWGENQQIALALGIANGTSGDSAGLSWGWLLNYGENYAGVMWAPINVTTGNFIGWQSGLVNYAGGSMMGYQAAVVNYAGKLTGLQFGLVNYARTADAGVQIGLVNIIRSNTEWFTGLPRELAPGMIFVNWGF
jgi:hypothetical protein